MDRETLFRKLEHISNLPTLPAIMERLNKAVNDVNTDAKLISNIIRDDPSMMARILKVANSAAYGASEPIVSVENAVARMGFVGIKNIALSTALFSSFGDDKSDDFDKEDFWRHSVSVGIATNVLYEHTRENLSRRYTPDILHLCGLLHDIGKIVFEQFFHDMFMQALQLSADKQIPLFEAEKSVFGADHADVGRWLTTKWNLPREVSEAIRFHHEPENADEKLRDIVRLTHTANYVCNMEQLGSSGDNNVPVFIIGVWKRIGLRVRDIQGIVKEIKAGAEHSETLLSFMK